MRAKILIFGALGAAAVMMLTSERARTMREKLEEKAKEKAGKWNRKLRKLGHNTTSTIDDLRALLNTEIDGLSEKARATIEEALNNVPA